MEDKEAVEQEQYLSMIHESVRKTLNHEQKQDIVAAMRRLGGPARKHLLDLRFTFWFIKRWYVVLLAGQDRRKKKRDLGYRMLQKGAILFLQLVFYGVITCIVLLGLYVLKSAVGIDIFPDFHLKDLFPW